MSEERHNLIQKLFSRGGERPGYRSIPEQNGRGEDNRLPEGTARFLSELGRLFGFTTLPSENEPVPSLMAGAGAARPFSDGNGAPLPRPAQAEAQAQSEAWPHKAPSYRGAADPWGVTIRHANPDPAYQKNRPHDPPPQTKIPNHTRKEGEQMNSTRKTAVAPRKRSRLVTGLLAAVMTLSLLPANGFKLLVGALEAGELPTKVAINVDAMNNPNGSGEFPTLTVETNAVIDVTGKLTGFVEVAVRVRPGVLHLSSTGNIVPSESDPAYDHSEIQPFSGVEFALEYSDKLTPWTWDKTDGNWQPLDPDLPGNESTYYNLADTVGMGFETWGMMEVQTLDEKVQISQATVSANPDKNGNGKWDDGGCLYMMAGGFDDRSFPTKDVNGKTVPEDTVVCVVRFKYDLDETNEDNNPWSSMFPDKMRTSGVTDWIDPTKADCLIKKTSAAFLFSAEEPITMHEVGYDSGPSQAREFGNHMDHSDDPVYECDAADTTLLDTDPNYLGKYNHIPMATINPAGNDTTVVVPGQINFTLVNKLSYADAGNQQSAVILYYDWDDKHIGTQIVDPGDGREAVNEFVEQHFIHPDLRYSTHQGSANEADYTSSLLREYTYRGEYPYNAPVAIPDAASDTFEADKAAYDASIASRVAPDGAKYPLTNKLDYVFYKRYSPMSQTVTDPDGIPNSGDEIYTDCKTLVDPDAIPNSGDEVYHIDQYDARILTYVNSADVAEPEVLELPYIYGWAVVEDLENISDVWTTLGTAEHTTYNGMDASKAPIDTTLDTNLTGTGGCLQFADFSDLQKGQVIKVKAVYEPGTILRTLSLGTEANYAPLSSPDYVRYGSDDVSVGGVYAITYHYGRVNVNGYGVERARDPLVRLTYSPDVEGEKGINFSLGLAATNTDIIDVEFTPSSGIFDLNYNLSDKRQYQTATQAMKEYNFYEASVRSFTGNELDVYTNFNYEGHSYDERRGTFGFVTEATLNQILRYGSEAIRTGDSSAYEAIMNRPTIQDLNWRMDVTGKEPTAVDMISLRPFILDAIDTAITAGLVDADGNADLDWHQIQHYILNATYDMGTQTITVSGFSGGIPTVSTLAYNWCRIDDCSGGSAPIPDWSTFMKAAADYVYTPNTNALNQLQGVFELRKGITAEPFADKDAMKAAVLKILDEPIGMSGLKQKGFTQAQVEALTWKQVQYLLDVGTSGITSPADLPADTDIGPNATVKKDYWWQNSGTKTIDTWQELLEIRYLVVNNGYFAGDTDNKGWLSEYTLNDKLTGKVRDKDSSGNWLAPGTNYVDMDIALRKNDKGQAFDTMPQFLSALDTALGVLGTAYPGGVFTNVSLMEIQHALLNKPYDTEPNLMKDGPVPTNPPVNYWWITGVAAPTTLKELVELVESAIDANSDDMLKVIKAEDMAKAPFWLRADDDGKPFASDAALHAALKTAIPAWKTGLGGSFSVIPDTEWPNAGPKDSGDNWSATNVKKTWAQLQHLLIPGNSYVADPEADPPTGAGKNYWWYGDNHRPIENLDDLMEAAWNTWGGGSGNAPADSLDEKAMDALNASTPAERDAILELINGIEGDPNPENYLYLRADKDGKEFSGDSGLAAFRDRIKSIIDRVYIMGKNFLIDPATGKTKLTWLQIQYMILENDYKTDSQLQGANLNYWWENGGSKPAGQDIDALAGQFSQVITEAYWTTSAYNQTDVDNIIRDLLGQLHFSKDSTGTDFYCVHDAAAIQSILEAMMDDDDADSSVDFSQDGGDSDTFTWNQIQYYILNNTLLAESAIPETDKSSYTWRPDGGPVNTLANQFSQVITEAYWTTSAYNQTDVDNIIRDSIGQLHFSKDATGTSFYCNHDAAAIQSILEAMMDDDDADSSVDFSLDGGDSDTFTWNEIQYYILNTTLTAESAIPTADKSSYTWRPGGAVATSFSLRPTIAAPMKTPAKAPEPVTETTTSDDGLTKTTKVTEKVYNLDTGLYDTVTTVTAVTRAEKNGMTTVTTTVTTIVVSVDPKTGEVSVVTDSDSWTEFETAEEPVYQNGQDTQIKGGAADGESDGTTDKETAKDTYTNNKDTDVVEGGDGADMDAGSDDGTLPPSVTGSASSADDTVSPAGSVSGEQAPLAPTAPQGEGLKGEGSTEGDTSNDTDTDIPTDTASGGPVWAPAPTEGIETDATDTAGGSDNGTLPPSVTGSASSADDTVSPAGSVSGEQAPLAPTAPQGEGLKGGDTDASAVNGTSSVGTNLGAPAEAVPSFSGERKEPGMDELSGAPQPGSEGYEGAPNDVGPLGTTGQDSTDGTVEVETPNSTVGAAALGGPNGTTGQDSTNDPDPVTPDDELAADTVSYAAAPERQRIPRDPTDGTKLVLRQLEENSLAGGISITTTETVEEALTGSQVVTGLGDTTKDPIIEKGFVNTVGTDVLIGPPGTTDMKPSNGTASTTVIMTSNSGPMRTSVPTEGLGTGTGTVETTPGSSRQRLLWENRWKLWKRDLSKIVLYEKPEGKEVSGSVWTMKYGLRSPGITRRETPGLLAGSPSSREGPPRGKTEARTAKYYYFTAGGHCYE